MDALTLTLLAEQTPARKITYTGKINGQHSNWPMHAGCALAWVTLFGRAMVVPERFDKLSLPGHAAHHVCWYCEHCDYAE